MKAPELSTLCYIEKDGKYLMLHRVVKEKDVNKGKWIGVGGHFEEGESPEECVLREVKEETGYTLTSFHYRGQLTFICGDEIYFCFYCRWLYRGAHCLRRRRSGMDSEGRDPEAESLGR